ncbi:MAG: hypothetical protein HYT03_00525 [Candidatus Harrisonbacteria bacterium]|nr:hypothetical protein [Candidatus Harrisonbacteria bacterium]
MNKKLLLSILVVIAVAFALHASIPGIPDTDAFYHIRHSWLYRAGGIFQSSFPWTQYSVINQYSADIWYGFHILIIPFTFFSDLIKGMTTGGFAVNLAAVFLVFAALSRLKVKWPLFWTFLFWFASADVLFRLTMLRPHPLSMGLSLIIFAYLATPRTKYTLPIIFFSAATISWIHLSLSWLPILVGLAVAGVAILKKEIQPIKNALLIIPGILLGWVLRPNFLGAAKIAYIQVVQLVVEKQFGAEFLRFGRELRPFVFENFADQLVPISVLMTLGICLIFWKVFLKKIKTATATWASLGLAVLFFTLAFTLARRANDIFIGFAAIFLGLLFTELFMEKRLFTAKWVMPVLTTTVAIILVAMPIKNIYRFGTYLQNVFDPQRFSEASKWLIKNSQPGEIVFSPNWDRFGPLFFWNWQNYYINGMDPIFEFAYDQSLYWKTHFLSVDQGAAITCGMVRCRAGEAEDTHLVLKRDFKASYIIVEKTRSPRLYEYVAKTDGFKKVFETVSEGVFKIL